MTLTGKAAAVKEYGVRPRLGASLGLFSIGTDI